MSLMSNDPIPQFAEGVPKGLFAVDVQTPMEQLERAYKEGLESTRGDLSDAALIAEITRGNEAVARASSGVSMLADMLDKLWAKYEHSFRALTLHSSKGMQQNRYTAETRVPGAVAFAHLIASNSDATNAPLNAPKHMPMPAIVTGENTDANETVDTLVSAAEVLAANVLYECDTVMRLKNAEGTSGAGHLAVCSMKVNAERLTRLLGMLADVWKQQRQQLCFVADATLRTELALRRPENGFSALPLQ